MNKIIHGDCLIELKTLDENSVDSIVTDPPYELGFMGKSWDNTGIANNKDMWAECLRVLKPGGHLLAFSGTRTYHRMASAIEDAGFEVRDMLCWAYGQGFPKSLNVFKQLQKECKCGNMDIYENRIKQVGKNCEQEAEYFLRFMQEANLSQTIGAEKERGEVLQSGLSEQNTYETMQGKEPKESIENGKEPSVEGRYNLQTTKRELQGSNLCEMSSGVFENGEERRLHNATQISDGSTPKQTLNENGSSASQRPQSEQQQYREPCAFCKQYGTQTIRSYGVGSALKPSIEPICFSRKPLEKGLTIAKNVLKYGTGGINIDESRVEAQGKDLDKLNSEWDREWNTNYSDYADKVGGSAGFNMDKAKKENAGLSGRFPANLLHDNSEEVRECFPENKSSNAIRKNKVKTGLNGIYNEYEAQDSYGFSDSGNASRFFKSIIYQAKASKSERNKGCEGLEDGEVVRQGLAGEHNNPTHKNNHPTVKPIALMEYLIKMVTPKDGVVLDPFAGSGSTLVAAQQNGFKYIGIEMTAEYIPIIEARLNSIK